MNKNKAISLSQYFLISTLMAKECQQYRVPGIKTEPKNGSRSINWGGGAKPLLFRLAPSPPLVVLPTYIPTYIS